MFLVKNINPLLKPHVVCCGGFIRKHLRHTASVIVYSCFTARVTTRCIQRKRECCGSILTFSFIEPVA